MPRVIDLSLPRYALEPRRSQQGFSLIEISIAMAILLLIAVMAVPSIQPYLVESRVPRVAEALQRFVARTKVQSAWGVAVPYLGLRTATLANAVRDSGALSVLGEGAEARVLHGLGAGEVRAAPAAVAGAGLGSAFTLTLERVHVAACPGLVSALQGLASIVSVQGVASAVQVKDLSARAPKTYDPVMAAAQCTSGDRNTFVFTFQ